MAKKFVDRGELLKGVNRTVRDSRVPYPLARNIENLTLPDGKAKRRAGYDEVNSIRIKDQWLTKVTGSVLERREFASQIGKQVAYKTPLSYALIRHKSTLQPTTVADWSIEFYCQLGDHEDLVHSPFQRHAKKTGTPAYDMNLRKAGVYILDWTTLSNMHAFDSTGTIASPGTIVTLNEEHNAGEQHYDSFPLTVLSVSFTKTTLTATMGMVRRATATLGRYWPKEVELTYTFPGGGYTPGDNYHIALTYNHSSGSPDTGVVKLYINGVSTATYSVADAEDYGFIGQYDVINNLTYSGGCPRDIVLLNECTVRGSLNSHCKIQAEMHGHQVFNHNYANDLTDPAAPWCCSPPRGTKIRDLRFWSDERSAAELLANKTTSITTSGSNLVASWLMNDGGPINYDAIGNLACTLHHHTPGYVATNDLLHNLGINFADGQYLKYRIKETDAHFVDEAGGMLFGTFGYDAPTSGAAWDWHQDRHGCSVQMQIRTPTVFQTELNECESGGTYLVNTLSSAPEATAGTQETRQSITGTATFNNAVPRNRLLDGQAPTTAKTTAPVTLGGVIIGDYSGDTAEPEYTRAYDATLFSIEGHAKSRITDSDGTGRIIPIFRGLLTPDGKVALEATVTGFDGSSNKPRLIRLVSTTTLTVDTVYTLTFVKRMTHASHYPNHPAGFQIEIWIGAGATEPTAADAISKRQISDAIAPTGAEHTVGATHTIEVAVPSHLDHTGTSLQVTLAGIDGNLGTQINGSHIATVASATTITIAENTTGKTYTAPGTCTFDNFIRSSPVNHSDDISILVGCSQVDSAWDNSISSPYNGGGTGVGPYLVQKQMNSPYQQQPGFFELGFFRVWCEAITAGEIIKNHASSIASSDYTPTLLINAEIESNTGDKILNRCRYPLSMRMGYTGWGEPQGREHTLLSASTKDFLEALEPMVSGAFMMEDCLGYTHFQPSAYTTGVDAKATCLAPFQSLVTQRYGLIFGFQDSLGIDLDLNGTFADLFLQGHGILNDFATKSVWRGLTVSGRTILTSDGGVPKVYNGKNLLVAGMKAFSGGRPIVDTDSSLGTGLDIGHYGVAVVYRAQEYGLVHISDRALIELEDKSAIVLGKIPAHYDPRITSIAIYRTQSQATKALAEVAPLFPTSDKFYANAEIPLAILDGDDGTLFPAPISLNQYPLPNCRYAAATNGRVYYAGDPSLPDAVYFSDLNNPEKVDIIRGRLLLDHGSGDRINGIIALFGTVFVFKGNSIWRIEEIGGGRHQKIKIADVGCVSDKAILSITIPDTGRTSICFWSHQGPYIFDGASLAYIGFPIEDNNPLDTGAPTVEWDWLEPQSVIAMHDLKNKEIVFCFRPVVSGTTKALHDEAVAYNYRWQSWVRYTGMVTELAFSSAFSGDTLPTASFSDTTNHTLDLTHEYIIYMGSDTGRLYKWGADESDGIPHPNSNSGPFTITGTDATNSITVSGATFSGDYRHLWLTIYRPSTGAHYNARILSQTGTTIFVFDTTGTGYFSPAINDILYVCLPYAELEFPWDDLGIPFVEKEVEDIILWYDKKWWLRISADWDASGNVLFSYTELATGSNKRKKVHINKSAEAVRIKLTSYEKQAVMDAIAMQVEYREDGIT